MPASRKEKDSTNHQEHKSINHPAGPKYLKDLALQHKPTPQGGHAPEHQEGWEGKTARPADRTTRVMSGKPASGPRNATLRVFVCNFCSTAEMVPWCDQNPDCGHPECTEALARCAAPHRLDDRRFHGQVNMAIIERQLWERYEEVMAEEAS